KVSYLNWVAPARDTWDAALAVVYTGQLIRAMLPPYSNIAWEAAGWGLSNTKPIPPERLTATPFFSKTSQWTKGNPLPRASDTAKASRSFPTPLLRNAG